MFGKLLNIEKKVSDSVNETLKNGVRFNFSKEDLNRIKESFREEISEAVKVIGSVNETLKNDIRFNFSKYINKIKESFREVLVANMDPFVNMYTKNQTRWAWVFILLFLILFIILIKK